MKLLTVTAEEFKLDGGACFGAIPRSLWYKSMRPDELNRIHIGLRLLLIISDNRKILVDTGIGNKQNEKFKLQMKISGFENLVTNLRYHSLTPDDITDVVFTHLHFDHVGGASYFDKEKNQYVPIFKHAHHWCSEEQWVWATEKHSVRERASYLKENSAFLKPGENLSFVKSNSFNIPNLTFNIFNGHTPGQLIPFIRYKNKTIVYVADFIPSLAHIPIPYISAYDVEPLIAFNEKEEFLIEAAQQNYILLFQHDMLNECCSVKQTEKGIHPHKVFKLSDLV